MANETPARTNFRFAHRMRVRWVEVDMQKIVFNGHYLMYFDTAVSDYWRKLLLPYPQALHDWSADLYVKKASVTYHASAQYDDMLEVCMKCAHIGTSSMRFAGAIFSGSRCLVEAELIYVHADPATQRSKPMAEPLRGWLESFERGEEMASVALEPWATAESEIVGLRTRVFHQELGIDAALLCDEKDPCCTHAVVRNRMGQAVAAGRMVMSGQTAVVGRMVAHRALRGAGLGATILGALEQSAWLGGASGVILSAMLAAEGFYAKLGYARQGDVFDQVGHAHVNMHKTAPKKEGGAT